MRLTAEDLKKVEEASEHQDSRGIEISLADWASIKSTIAYYSNMQGEKFVAPLLSQATDSFLVDELGLMREEIKARQTYEKLLKSVIELRLPAGQQYLEGEDYGVFFQNKSRSTLSKDAVVAKYGNVDDCYKSTDYVEAKTSKKKK